MSVEFSRIPSLSEKYVAGSDGHIYATIRHRARLVSPVRLAASLGSEGYPFVAIIEDGRRRTKAVHTLVCAAFHGPKPLPYLVARHLDGDKTNSVPANLAWGTCAENEADKRRHGRVAAGERHGQVKLTAEAVRIIRASIPFGLWNVADAAKVFGVDPSTIRRVAAAKRDWRDVCLREDGFAYTPLGREASHG